MPSAGIAYAVSGCQQGICACPGRAETQVAFRSGRPLSPFSGQAATRPLVSLLLASQNSPVIRWSVPLRSTETNEVFGELPLRHSYFPVAVRGTVLVYAATSGIT